MCCSAAQVYVILSADALPRAALQLAAVFCAPSCPVPAINACIAFEHSMEIRVDSFMTFMSAFVQRLEFMRIIAVSFRDSWTGLEGAVAVQLHRCDQRVKRNPE